MDYSWISVKVKELHPSEVANVPHKHVCSISDGNWYVWPQFRSSRIALASTHFWFDYICQRKQSTHSWLSYIYQLQYTKMLSEPFLLQVAVKYCSISNRLRRRKVNMMDQHRPRLKLLMRFFLIYLGFCFSAFILCVQY